VDTIVGALGPKLTISQGSKLALIAIRRWALKGKELPVSGARGTLGVVGRIVVLPAGGVNFQGLAVAAIC
jgi:hypothetical protein